jgi:long-chain fatty acid transport protein
MLKRWLMGTLLLLLSTGVQTAMAQGVIFPSAGAINRAMAGASTAAPLDPAGAMYWNPATMSGLPKSEIFVGGDFVYGDTFLSSAVAATGRAGSNRSDSGLAAAPVIGAAYRSEESTYTWGLGIYSLLGRTIDFPGSDTNPVLTPFDPPNSFGFGPVSTNASGVQIALMMSKQLSSGFAVGGGLTVNSLSLSLDPALFATRNSNGTFPPATNSRPGWGAGFEVGGFYSGSSKWNFGASFKSEQWFETFRYFSKDQTGAARDLRLELSLPAIFSFGVAYKGMERTMIAVDARRFNYDSTKFFGDRPENGGLGWRSIWAFAVGAHHRFNESVSAQFGYLYNQNPIPDAATLLNIQLPAINTHSISGGVTVAMTSSVDIVGSAVYAFKHRNLGTVLEIPGTAIELEQDLGTFSLGLRFRL